MPKHKTEDYKLSAIKYYLKNDFSMEYVCDIFECKKQSLSRWVDRYLLENSIKRHNRLPVSYKIKKKHLLLLFLFILLYNFSNLIITQIIKGIKEII